VLGAYLWLYPRARVDCLLVLIVFFTVVSLPAYLVLGVWFVGQMLSATSKSPGVAWFAHIGGFVAGLLVAMLLMRRRPEDSAGWEEENRFRAYTPPRHGGLRGVES
jgi:membrane associated rhomboid family serine protease